MTDAERAVVLYQRKAGFVAKIKSALSILALYESEEGQREFQKWKAQREAEKTEGKAGKPESK